MLSCRKILGHLCTAETASQGPQKDVLEESIPKKDIPKKASHRKASRGTWEPSQGFAQNRTCMPAGKNSNFNAWTHA